MNSCTALEANYVLTRLYSTKHSADGCGGRKSRYNPEESVLSHVDICNQVALRMSIRKSSTTYSEIIDLSNIHIRYLQHFLQSRHKLTYLQKVTPHGILKASILVPWNQCPARKRIVPCSPPGIWDYSDADRCQHRKQRLGS